MRAGPRRGPTAEGGPRHLAKEQVNHVHSAPTSPGRRALAVILAIIGVLAIIAGILYAAGAANSLHFMVGSVHKGHHLVRAAGIELPLAASECLQLPHPASPRARDRQALGLLEESPADRNLVMILTGPHDRLPSWPTAAPGLATGSPRSSTSRPPPAPYWLPSSPSEPTTPGKQAIVRRLPNCGIRNVQQRLPEIDTGRTLIARSSTGSVGPGERIGQRGDAGEHQQTLADRAQQNTCSGAAEESRRRPGLPTISAATRASGGGHVVAV
jgi:hypothetical protein